MLKSFFVIVVAEIGKAVMAGIEGEGSCDRRKSGNFFGGGMTTVTKT